MAKIQDVARYILEQHGSMTAMKLQKLCYYSQAWSLVWDEERLFPSRIEAWANGPVSPELYKMHSGLFRVDVADIHGDASALTEDEKATVDAVLKFYGDMGAWDLSNLTHKEAPWKEARGNTPDGERSNAEITCAAMAEYYGSLTD